MRDISARDIFVLPIRAYQRVVSPSLPQSCKYHPSCSQYAVDAVRGHGVARGLVLASWRVMRCNPWSHGGYDPVEKQSLFRSSASAEAHEAHEAVCSEHTHDHEVSAR